MSDVSLSEYFFYYFAKHAVPSGYQPVLQIAQSRKSSSGYRMKIFDGFFFNSACYVHDQALIESLPDLTNKSPKVRVTAYEEQQAGRTVFTIYDLEILDIDCELPENNSHYPINDDLSAYEEYMFDKSLPPCNDEIAELKPAAAKRPRLAKNVLDSVRSPQSGAVVQYRLPHQGAPNNDQNVTPFNLITPFCNKWRICGLCIHKSFREVNSPTKGQLRVAEFHLSDENGKTLKIVAWNETADNVNAIVNESQMYYVAGDQGCIRKKNSRFNQTDCDYEIQLKQTCHVTLCTDRHFDPPKFSINRKALGEITNSDESFDILAVVDKIGDKGQIMVKSKNAEVPKRDIVLVDDSLASITLTLWDEKCDLPFNSVGEVVAIKSAKIKEFNGSLSLALTTRSTVVINPEIEGADDMSRWYSDSRPTAEIVSLSVGGGSNANFNADLRSLGAVKNSQMLETVPHGIYLYAKAEITEVRKENTYYPACLQCNKKVVPNEYGGGLRCEKCDLTNPPFKNRFMLNMQLSDGTDTAYVTLFDEQAQSLLQMDATRMEELYQENKEEYEKIFDKLLFHSVVVRMKVQNDYYNDQKRLKFTVYSVQQVPFEKYTASLDKALEVLENL